jgi:hypothetical protein
MAWLISEYIKYTNAEVSVNFRQQQRFARNK